MLKYNVLLLVTIVSYILAIHEIGDSSNVFSKRYLVNCWERSYNPSSPWSSFAPIIPSDCLKAAQQVACPGDMLSRVRFSRAPDAAGHLPFIFVNGTCKVRLDIIAPENPTETTTLLEIHNRILEITKKCVMSRSTRRLGGYSTVGNADLIQITVSGNAVISDEGSVLAGLAAIDACKILR